MRDSLASVSGRIRTAVCAFSTSDRAMAKDSSMEVGIADLGNGLGQFRSPAPHLESPSNEVAVRTLFQIQKGRQGKHSIQEIAPNGLPHGLLVPDEIQKVIHDLKSQSPGSSRRF